MSDWEELQDRIADRIWLNTMVTSEGSMRIAQEIIDDLGLTVEERLTEFGIDDPGYESRVVGKWEDKIEQEPRP